MQDAIGRLAERLGNRELIHLLVVALLQVNDFTFGGAGDQDHRKTVRGCMRERRQAIEESGR